jgi:hypothetical protein
MKMRHLSTLPLAFGALLLAACHGSSPTEPSAASFDSKALATSESTAGTTDETPGRFSRALAARAAAGDAAETASATDTASIEEAKKPTNPGGGHGNGGNGGNGNGGNGNGGNGGSGNGGNGGGHGNHGGALALAIQPDVWNTNYDHSEGTISALVRGGDAAKIDPSSVTLSCEGGGTAEPSRTQTAGGQLRAFFTKQDAFACLSDPDPGESFDVTLKFNVVASDGTSTAKELTASVRIVGKPTDDDGEDDGETEAELSIQPDDWNTNWRHAQGTVSALLRGDVADVDLTSIVLVGDKGTEVHPVDVRRNGKNQIRARFPMADAFNSLDDPDPGETHTVKVKFSVAGAGGTSTAKELTDEVHIVGPAIP